MQRARSVWGRCRSLCAMTRALAEKELGEMTTMELLTEAEAVGIRLTVEDECLHIRGPRSAEALGRLLLERKTEVLAVLAASQQQMAETSTPADTNSAWWDAERAVAILVEVDTQIEAALLTALIADQPARQRVLANEQHIVRQLAQRHDPFLWTWPQALQCLLDRWKEQDAEHHLRTPCARWPLVRPRCPTSRPICRYRSETKREEAPPCGAS